MNYDIGIEPNELANYNNVKKYYSATIVKRSNNESCVLELYLNDVRDNFEHVKKYLLTIINLGNSDAMCAN
jgi:hypothetical protein